MHQFNNKRQSSSIKSLSDYSDSVVSAESSWRLVLFSIPHGWRIRQITLFSVPTPTSTPTYL